jgi:hypothetical protein
MKIGISMKLPLRNLTRSQSGFVRPQEPVFIADSSNVPGMQAIEYILSSGLAEVLVVSNKRRRRAKSTIDIEEEAASLGLYCESFRNE